MVVHQLRYPDGSFTSENIGRVSRCAQGRLSQIRDDWNHSRWRWRLCDQWTSFLFDPCNLYPSSFFWPIENHTIWWCRKRISISSCSAIPNGRDSVTEQPHQLPPCESQDSSFAYLSTSGDTLPDPSDVWYPSVDYGHHHQYRNWEQNYLWWVMSPSNSLKTSGPQWVAFCFCSRCYQMQRHITPGRYLHGWYPHDSSRLYGPTVW